MRAQPQALLCNPCPSAVKFECSLQVRKGAPRARERCPRALRKHRKQQVIRVIRDTRSARISRARATDPLYSRCAVTDDSALRREALRVYRRYMLEVVEGFDLCPWAASARRDGRVVESVILGEKLADPSQSLAQLSALEPQPKTEIALFIYPDLELDRLSFESFVRTLRERDAARHELGEIPFAMAAFHPDARADTGDPERLIPFLRRTPDPTIQVVRLAALERVRGKSQEGTSFFDLANLAVLPLPRKEPVSLRQRIAQNNLETALKVGVAALEAVLADIRRDRDESYARLRA